MGKKLSLRRPLNIQILYAYSAIANVSQPNSYCRCGANLLLRSSAQLNRVTKKKGSRGRKKGSDIYLVLWSREDHQYQFARKPTLSSLVVNFAGKEDMSVLAEVNSFATIFGGIATGRVSRDDFCQEARRTMVASRCLILFFCKLIIHRK